MRTRAAAAAVAVFVPVVLLVNGIGLIAHGWFVRAEYAHLSPDRYGMTKTERVRLAEDALEAIVPWGAGTSALGKEFSAKEVRHLDDVRTLLVALFAAHAAGVLALTGLALHPRTRAVAVLALRIGVALTLAIAVFVALFVAISPVGFLGGFHRFFFSGDSWRFAEHDTLRRLFPDRFWAETAIVLGALTAAQAAAIGLVLRLRRRQAFARPARTSSA
jgi:integral membrane protein (TIGR01906 family)